MYSDFLTRNQTNIYLRYLQPSVDYTAINKMATTNDFYVKRTGVNEDGPLEAITVDGSSSPELLKSASQRMEESFKGKAACCSSLSAACRADHPECVKTLLEKGENPTASVNGRYALIEAALHEDGKCLRLLLECDGIDIGVKMCGTTAFELAAFHGCLQNVMMILDSGVGDPNIKGAISLAVSNSRFAVLEYLLQLKPEFCVEDEIAAAKLAHSRSHSAASESCLRALIEYKSPSVKYYLVIVITRHSDPDVYLIDPAKVSDALLHEMRDQMGDYPSFLYTWTKNLENPPPRIDVNRCIKINFDEFQNFTVCRTFFYNA
jgi:hypothetical protein